MIVRTSVLMKFRFGSKNILADYDRDEKIYGQRNAQWRMHDCISRHRKANIRQRKKGQTLTATFIFFTLDFLLAGAASGLLLAIFGSKKKTKKTARGSDGRALMNETFLAFTRPHLASKNKNPQAGITSPFDH